MLSEQSFEITLLHLFSSKNPRTQCYLFKCQGEVCVNRARDQRPTNSEKLKNTENRVKNWTKFSCVLTKWVLSLRLALGSAAQWLSKRWQAVHSPWAPLDARGTPCSLPSLSSPVASALAAGPLFPFLISCDDAQALWRKEQSPLTPEGWCRGQQSGEVKHLQQPPGLCTHTALHIINSKQ